MTALARLALLGLTLAVGCSAPADSSPVTQPPAPPGPEAALREVPLVAPWDDRQVEFSGMAWHGDALILLPQYPGTWNDRAPALAWASKAEVLAALDEGRPLTLRELPLDLAGVPERAPDYQGFEAIAFRGDEAWLAIECDARGWLVRGRMQPGRAGLTLDPDTLRPVAYPRHMRNMGFEAVLATDGGAVALFEANGAALTAVGERDGAWLDLQGELARVLVGALEYRITDATDLDPQGRFWVSNYLYHKDAALICPRDPLRTEPLPTHDRYPWVERLVELELIESEGRREVRLSGRPPVWLTLQDDDGRNWEGIVRLDDRGFLLVTDKYPRTILAFVESPAVER
ncbi:MAG: hypothetical protein R3F62_05255 [Planctomycetota bacterium]